MLKLSGAATQINATASVQYFAQSGDYIFYDTSADALAPNGPSQILARALDPTLGSPTGVELSFILPILQSGYSRSAGSGLVPLADGSFVLEDLSWNSATGALHWEIDHYSASGTMLGTAASGTAADAFSLPNVAFRPDGSFDLISSSSSTSGGVTSVSLVGTTYDLNGAAISGSTTLYSESAPATDQLMMFGKEAFSASASAIVTSSLLQPSVGDWRASVIVQLSWLHAPITESASGLSSLNPFGGHFAADGSFIYGITTSTTDLATGSSSGSFDVYRVPFGSATASKILSTVESKLTAYGADVTILGNGDIDLRTVTFGPTGNAYSDRVYSSSGKLLGVVNNGSVFETADGSLMATYSANGDIYTQALQFVQNVKSDFTASGVSGILFRAADTGDTGFYQLNADGTLQGWRGLGASSTNYSIVGTGDFNGDGVADVLFRDDATGDTGFYQLAGDGSGAVQGWHDLGASSTAYAVAGTGDFNGDGVSDVLFRNAATGDTGFYQLANDGSGTVHGWRSIGATDTSYAVVGTGDFNGDGIADVLFRNGATGDTGFDQLNSDGSLEGWHSIGGSSTAYSVAGTGDFNGDGVSDVLFRNSTTGDVGYYQMNSGGTLQGWHEIGGSSTDYSVVATGDYNGDGVSDVLFRNGSTGDTGFYQLDTNGQLQGWHGIGASSTAYAIVGG